MWCECSIEKERERETETETEKEREFLSVCVNKFELLEVYSKLDGRAYNAITFIM